MRPPMARIAERTADRPTPRPDTSLAPSRVVTPSANNAVSRFLAGLGRQPLRARTLRDGVPVQATTVVSYFDNDFVIFHAARELDDRIFGFGERTTFFHRFDAMVDGVANEVERLTRRARAVLGKRTGRH